MWFNTTKKETYKYVDGFIIVTDESGFTTHSQKCNSQTWEALNTNWEDNENFINFTPTPLT